MLTSFILIFLMSVNSYLNFEWECYSTEIQVNFNSKLKYLGKERILQNRFFFSLFSPSRVVRKRDSIKLWSLFHPESSAHMDQGQTLMLGGVSTAVSCSGLFLQLHLHKTLRAASL